MSPQRFLDRLTVAALVRQIIALAGQAPTLTDAELVNRLMVLAGCGCGDRYRATHRRDAAGEGAAVTGHGLLSRFHAGCRCGWCASRAREA